MVSKKTIDKEIGNFIRVLNYCYRYFDFFVTTKNPQIPNV